MSSTGTDTPGERAALALPTEKVKLLSQNQEPNTVYALSINGSVSENGQWTIFGLAQELEVHRNWLYTRIHKGTLPATRHSVTGHYLIADEPQILATLRAQRDRCCYR